MKHAALIFAALAAILTAAAAPVRTATEGFVTNKIAEAVAAIPTPDYSTNNAALVATIQATAPAPGDYANVSNKAVNAVGVDKLPTIEGYGFTNWYNNIKITNTDGYLSINPSLAIYGGMSGGGPSERVSLFAGWNLDLSNTFWDELAETDPTVPAWAKAQTKPTYTASEVGAYSTGAVDEILQGYLPLDYFHDGQTIPMYWGDGTKLCDFGANWLGNLVDTVSEKPDADDIPPAVSNIVTTALVRERLGVYLYVGADGGIYVHTNED